MSHTYRNSSYHTKFLNPSVIGRQSITKYEFHCYDLLLCNNTYKGSGVCFSGRKSNCKKFFKRHVHKCDRGRKRKFLSSELNEMFFE